MKVIDNLKDLNGAKFGKLVAALGNFDGVHHGHRKLIKEAVDTARAAGKMAAVVTFMPHPLKILAPERFPKLLTTLNQRLGFFADLGVDLVALVPFTRELAAQSPRQFAELLNRIGVSHVCVGFNYSFGSGGAGGPRELERLGQELGFSVSIIQPQRVNGVVVSSSEIRRTLERGDVEEAAKYLGYWPTVSGIVVSGDRRGRTLGFPTANVEPPEDVLLPGNGVYAAWVKLEDGMFPAMVNIGSKPTFKSGPETTIEAHIFDFERDIYGYQVSVYFCKRLRSERKFSGIEELLTQLKIDQKMAYDFLRQQNLCEDGSMKQLMGL